MRETAREYQDQVDRVGEEISALREEVHAITERLNVEQGKRSEVRSRLASLEALQQAALQDNEGAVAQWLDAAKLRREDRLVERIRVVDGWERAVEAVLGAFVAGFEVSSLESYADRVGDFDKGTLVLLEVGDEQATASGTLADKASGSSGIRALLGQVRLADDIRQALQQRASLKPHQSVVTREGVWVGAELDAVALAGQGRRRGAFARAAHGCLAR